MVRTSFLFLPFLLIGCTEDGSNPSLHLPTEQSVEEQTVCISGDDSCDTDNDGAINGIDSDDDGDNVLDTTDNCQFMNNPTQADSDNDGIGDTCDWVATP